MNLLKNLETSAKERVTMLLVEHGKLRDKFCPTCFSDFIAIYRHWRDHSLNTILCNCERRKVGN